MYKINTKKLIREWKYVSALCCIVLLLLIFVIPAMSVTGNTVRITDFFPEGELRAPCEVKAVFSRNVVSKEYIGQTLCESDFPFIFHPEIKGRGYWKNGKTFVFTPFSKLLPATKYTVTALPKISAPGDGEKSYKIIGKKTFNFYRAPLKFKGIKLIEYNKYNNDAIYEIEFSEAVSPSKLRGYIEVNNIGYRGKYNVIDGPISSKVHLGIKNENSNTVPELKIIKGLPCENGNMGMKEDISVKLAVNGVMEISGASAYTSIRFGSISVTTTVPIDVSQVKDFIEIKPSKNITVEPTSAGFDIKGPFDSGERVKVTLKKGLPGLGDSKLDYDWQKTFIFPDRKCEISFPETGRILTHKDSMKLEVDTVNVDKMEVEIMRLYDNNIVYGLRNKWASFPIDLAQSVAKKKYNVKGRRNKVTASALDLKKLIGDSKGVFHISATNNGSYDEWTGDDIMLNVTDLGITYKHAYNKNLIWVNSIKTGKAIYGAEVKLWSWSNQLLGSGKTRLDGTAEIILPNTRELPIVITVSKDDDVAFIRSENSLFRSTDKFDISGQLWPSGAYDTYCYTDRDIYRPGDTICVNLVMRDKEGHAPNSFPVTVELKTSTGNTWKKITGLPDKFGTISFDIKTTDTVPTGAWQVLVYTGEENAVAVKRIFVESFVPPRLYIDSSTDKKKMTGKDKIKLSLASKYTFGSPASELVYEIKIANKKFKPSFKNLQGYRFGNDCCDYKHINRTVAEGKLGANGTDEITIENLSTENKCPELITIQTGVMEDSGRWDYVTSQVEHYPSDILTGVKIPKKIEPMKDFNISLATVDINGNFKENIKMSYTLNKIVSRPVTYLKDGKQYRKYTTEYVPIKKGFVTGKERKTNVTLNVAESGKYIFEVENGSGVTATEFYVYGYNGSGEENASILKMSMDKKIYKKGDKAHLSVTAPFDGIMLICVETDTIISHKVKKVNKGKNNITLRITEDMKPNAWITTQLIRSDCYDTNDIRAYGVMPIFVDMTDVKLAVSCDIPSKLKPGHNKIKIKVRNNSGKGVASSVTVMAVDDTVLHLTGYKAPNPFYYYTAQRALEVTTCDRYNMIIKPEYNGLPLLMAGGGMSREMSAMNDAQAPFRVDRFKIAAVTERTTTDKNGNGYIELNLPEFAGQMRFSVVAVSENAIGYTEKVCDVGREIIIEPSLPANLIEGDIFTSPCLIYNRGEKTDFELRVKTNGNISCEEEPRKITLENGKRSLIEIQYKVGKPGKAEVLYEIKYKSKVIRKTIEIAINPAAPKRIKSNIYKISGNNFVNIQEDYTKYGDSETGVLLVSAMPEIRLRNVVDFLTHYPYNCTEQTISAVIPLITMGNIICETMPNISNRKTINNDVAMGIRKLCTRQNYDGGFVSWPGEKDSQPFESIYALHCMCLAENNGYKVDNDVKQNAIKYVRRMLDILPEDPDNEKEWKMLLTLKAYGCYALSLAGTPPLSHMEYMTGKINDISGDGAIYLALAYEQAGNKKEALKIMPKETPSGIYGEMADNMYVSDIKHTALLLLGGTVLTPTCESNSVVAVSLLKKITENKISTQEGAVATMALSKYFKTISPIKKTTGEIYINGKKKATINELSDSVTCTVKAGDKIKITNTGAGDLYAMKSINRFCPVKESSFNGISVTGRMDLPNSDNIIRRGDKLTEIITITPISGAQKDVVVVIPLAAGIEGENPIVEENNIVDGVKIEKRDGRIILFISHLREKTTLQLNLRAVTPGTFIIPGISAQCMYDPSVNSVTVNKTITINK